MEVFYCAPVALPYSTSTVPLAQIAEYEAWKGQYKEKTGGNGVELPALRKDISDAGFKHIGNATKEEIQDNQFKQP